MKYLQTFNDLFEGKKGRINQKDYQFYVFNVDAKKIVEGFEYESDSKDRIKEIYEECDVPKEERGKLKSYTKKYLLGKGIDPNDDANWGKNPYFGK